MLARMRATLLAVTTAALWATLTHPSAAQDAPYGPYEAAPPPDEAPPSPEPAPYQEPPPAQVPQQQPAPQPYPQQVPQQQPYPPPQQQPAPQPYPPQEPQPAQRYDGQAGYGTDYPEAGGEDSGDDGKGFEMPGFSIRLDPFNWLLEGRLGLELEVGLWKIMSLELVPIFVANNEPPTFNLSGREDSVSQTSNGLGPIAGTSLGLSFWLQGEPFRGYVLRALFTNYGYAYKASDSGGTFDRVEQTERRLGGFFGSYSRFGFFTIGGGIGLMYELNPGERCDPVVTNVNGVDRLVGDPQGGCDELHIALERGASTSPPDIADLNGFLHPVYLQVRFSLGVAFD